MRSYIPIFPGTLWYSPGVGQWHWLKQPKGDMTAFFPMAIISTSSERQLSTTTSILFPPAVISRQSNALVFWEGKRLCGPNMLARKPSILGFGHVRLPLRNDSGLLQTYRM